MIKRTAIFIMAFLVLGGTACRILGMDEKESDALIERLMKWSEQPDYTYRHEWRLGDLVIWDNTGAMHRVMPFDAESRREFHRCTLNGEEAITGAMERAAEPA